VEKAEDPIQALKNEIARKFEFESKVISTKTLFGFS
jgi:hypothetical protein